MYYFSFSGTNNDTDKTITTLIEGIFTKDFILNSGYKYKVYKIKTNFEESDKQDLNVALSVVRGYYNMYLYDDLSKIKINNNNGFITFSGNVGESYSYLNQLCINKTQKYYKAKGTYYIVVYLSYFYSYINSSEDSYGLYSIAYKSENKHFILSDGIPITYYLQDNLNKTSFVYYHYPTNYSLLLSIANYGNLEFYYDFVDFKQDFVKANYNTTILDSYQVDPKLIKDKCEGKPRCEIFVGLKSKILFGQHFTLMAKTLNQKPILYTSGIIQNKYLLIDEYHYFYKYISPEDKGIIIVGFSNGIAGVFVNILSHEMSNKPQRDWNYPTSDKSEIESISSYYGQTISINSNVLTKCTPQCLILIGIKGLNLGFGENFIKYTFKFTTHLTQIYDNQPIIANIVEGEMQFYSFYSLSHVKNIYFSVNTNNAGGNTDIMVNYGGEFPTNQISDWKSDFSWAESIEITKEDGYFQTTGALINNSNYTIGIYGYSNSTYTLYVTTNPKKILPVGIYHSGSCKTKKDNDYCYFRYSEMYSLSSNVSYSQQILASAEFLYGQGTMYAKVYNISDIDVFKDVPTKESYDFSSEDQNIRNFLKIDLSEVIDKIKGKDFTEISLLFSVFCAKPCFLTLHTDVKYSSDSTKYLDSYRDNLVYLKKSSKVSMVFFYYEKNDLTIQTGVYSGSGDFKLYYNENYKTNNSISNFALNSVTQTNHQFIPVTHNGQINIDVETGNTDSAFYIKLSNNKEFTNIVVGKSQNFIIYHDEFFNAYFYFPKYYESLTINLHPKFHKTAAHMFVKIVKLDKSKKIKDHFASTPGPDNKDYDAKTDYNLQSVILNINLGNLKNRKYLEQF